MIGILVTGHGNFATGITTSVNLIAGKQSNYESVDFLMHYSIDDLEKRKEQFIKDLKEFIDEFESTEESSQLMKYYD